ncbi:DUF2585 family protein [Bythopirellula polymerisocia]|uniref:Uncharacterized protein n=1 Tax=Bythopirellula polymerisocia TaxID=2528003 RepID=A0A5C6D0H7_9BACT|nr:DUF2585 family protein [Bythopirellula polymerisocia]TWU30402.1 hypothetical protein Pla144_11880 [Bythopirellula polymerisocia]
MIKILQRKNWPLWAVGITLALMVVQLRAQRREWFCACGNLRLWISDPASSHTSQHLADPFTFTHFQHGLVLCFLVGWLAKSWKWPWQVWLALAIEAGWEIIENSQFVIDRYRSATAALGYTGDSIVNSLGDVLACWLGLVVAKKIGWNATWVLFFAIEVVLLITIRDSLLLNVLMLFYPIEVIKQWQLR